MDTTLNTSHQRAMDDLLQAERDLRTKSEENTRAMRQVLMVTANRLDGIRMQALQRSDPSIPARWGTLEWKKFFDDIPIPSKGWGDSITTAPDKRVERKLQKKITELQAALDQAELERTKAILVETPVSLPEEIKNPEQVLVVADEIGNIPPDATPALTVIVEDARRMHEKYPKETPSAFSNILSGGGRTGGDLTRVFKRYWLVLYLIGRWRLAATMELEEVLAETVKVSAGSGSMRRVMLDLEKANVLISEILELNSSQTALRLYRFSAEGEKLYQSLFGSRPLENDWSRLIRLHEGARFPAHTLAVLAFSMHARKRGWATKVLPEVSGSRSMADVWLMRANEHFYVEVELCEKERDGARWKNLSSLNEGHVALCAVNQKAHTRLVAECKLEKFPGLATNLETLVSGKFKNINSESPLWLETWK